jgi:ribosomal subunit interface protein
MHIKIKGSGSVLLTDELKQFIDEKLKKIEKIIGGDSTALVEVEVGTVTSHRTGEIFRAELNVSFAGTMARAEATREMLHAAIDKAVSEARREVRKIRSKERTMTRRGSAAVKDFLRKFGR